MEKFVIHGGKPLNGDVVIGGAKNAAVAILPATILAADKCTIENLPCISDVMASLQILSELGASIRMISKSTYEIDTTHLNCTEVSNELSRQIAAGGLTLDEAEAQLARAQRIPFPNDRVQLVAGLSGAFCFAMIFGGTLRAGLAAAVAGLAASSYLLLCERLNLPGGFRKITTASLITLVCLPLCHLLGTEASHAIIGTLMILTPGIAFTMGIRDFVQGDYLSGTIRMIDALLVAACIAIGTGFVLLCYSLLTGVNIA